MSHFDDTDVSYRTCGIIVPGRVDAAMALKEDMVDRPRDARLLGFAVSAKADRADVEALFGPGAQSSD